MSKEMTIKVRNYKNILNTSFSDEVILFSNKLNLITGENNVGKTNLLRSFNLLNMTMDKAKPKFSFETDWPETTIEVSKSDRDRLEKDFWVSLMEMSISSDDKDFLSSLFKSKIPSDIYEQLIKEKRIDLDTIEIYWMGSKSVGPVYSFLPIINTNEFNLSDKNMLSNINKIQKEAYDKIVNNYYPVVHNLIDTSFEKDNIIERFAFTIANLKDTNSEIMNFLRKFSNEKDFETILSYLVDLADAKPKTINDAGLTHDRNEKKRKIEKILSENINKSFSEIFTKLNTKINVEFSEDSAIQLVFVSTLQYKYAARNISDQGSGIKKVIKLIFLLKQLITTDKNHLILIDEIENCLSVNSQTFVINYLKSIIKKADNLFLVMTTHSPLFFDFFKTENLDEIYSLTICVKNDDGALLVDTVPSINSVCFENDGANNIGAGRILKNGKECSNGIDLLCYILDASKEIIESIIKEPRENKFKTSLR